MGELSHEVWGEYLRTPEHPVLFLDVDGVLNCEKDFREGHQLCQRKVKLLNGLPACDIVISSAWRIGAYQELVSALRWLGCKQHVIGKTRHAVGMEVRGNQIEDWLKENGNPNYAIVDDDGDMLDHQAAHFVQTNFRKGGLTAASIQKLSAILAPAHQTHRDGQG